MILAGPAPAIIDVSAPLDAVRMALIGLGAQLTERHSVALSLGDHLLLLATDADDSLSTTVAVGGSTPTCVAGWLVQQLSDVLHCAVRVIGNDLAGLPT